TGVNALTHATRFAFNVRHAVVIQRGYQNLAGVALPVQSVLAGNGVGLGFGKQLRGIAIEAHCHYTPRSRLARHLRAAAERLGITTAAATLPLTGEFDIHLPG